ncbi:bifunctional diguanylate cyclase/phosphodiesterase [Amphritea sp. 1_MG-2023]|uniref:putative bifunctional diguanylate cyclase/phosphodiesterase n=1 Tax=Amphritea sp. 1_MG-2023 TaxID=3062670 RepID=UPI0026E3DE78|nr:bifunctional diguanylate cyclase/phosphodiesterase [Amphritea sp. 1_MG-2023]MDO6564798.1 bifunctional diguanylate cyclase/phosphodiesterase [Amphritea sp. 1_MG-2023]
MLSVASSKAECLIIDSCGIDTSSIIKQLQRQQCSVIQCSFDQASERLTQSNVQLIFLHSCHTDTNALSELHYLRQTYPRIPVILFDEYLDAERINTSMLWQANDFISTALCTDDTLQRVLRYNLKVYQYHTEIERLNQLDPLTGMIHRQQFYKEFGEKLSSLKTTDTSSQFALICVDLDGFNRFNNLHGYAAGDSVVKKMGKRLTKLSSGLISRQGNDEFIMLQPICANENLTQSITALCNQIMHSLTEPYQYLDLEVILPCSIGVALSPKHSCETDILINQATQARIQAKQQSCCSYAVFEQQDSHSKQPQAPIEHELINAIRRNEFELFYQPRIDIMSGNIIGAEGLVRWRHPEKGLIYPDAFIPTAERTGLIVPIGYWVIQQAGLDIQRLISSGLRIKKMSINLSFRQFQDSYLSQTIQRLINKYAIDTTILEFELTESALFNNERHVREGIEALHKLGINFSLDDFGTGYSSFSLLQKLPISSLKIDRSFVGGASHNADDREIVKALIRLAHSLNKEIIAEGVETMGQLNFLTCHGCHQAQGYLYSKPVPYEEFKALLKNGYQLTAESTAMQ